jgi:HAE1 family hydrophobic/amphiphilic exporter-1
MILSSVSVRRPVFALMMAAALVLLGFFSYRDLGLDLMPKVDSPVVSVSVSLRGASAEEIETQITKPVEQAVNTISGVRELRANSDQGSSRVTITFTLERDIESAVQDVRDKIATIVQQFPRDTLPPVIQKSDPDSAPIITIRTTAPSRSQRELTEIVDKQVKQVLETVDGVGQVNFNGDRRREIQLLVNADRLNAYGLTIDQVRQAVQRQNVEVPGGSFFSGPSEIGVRTMGRLQNVPDFNRIVLTYRNGSAVTFGDVGRAIDTVAEPRNVIRMNGEPTVTVNVQKQSGSNTVDVVDKILARLEVIRATLPPDVTLLAVKDTSRFIRRSFEDIKIHLFLGSFLASLVVYLFVRNLRASLISALAIPASIVGTFTVMKAFGFTLNNMTMLALSLATGIVIDDAIVVLENVFRFVEEKGLTPKEAAVEATDEIGLAVMATTLSLVVIFLPVAFMTGEVGRYFFSFGVVSAAAILISMFVSFTLTPALCAWWLRESDVTHGHKGTKSGGLYARVDALYSRTLAWSLQHRGVLMGVAAAVVLSAVWIYPRVGKELVPDDDQGEFSVSVRLPSGTSLERTDQYVRDLERELAKLPEVDILQDNTSVSSSNFSIQLKPLEERTLSQQEIMRQARVLLASFKGARISVNGGTDLSGGSSVSTRSSSGGNRLQALIQGPDLAQLQAYASQLTDLMRTVPGLVDVDSSVDLTKPELRIAVDRARAADLGVAIDALGADLRTLMSGDEVSKFKDGDDQYSVQLRLDEPFRTPATVGNLLVPSSSGQPVKISDVAQIEMARGPVSIDRYNRQRQVTVTANLDRIPLGDAVAAVRPKIEELHLKSGYQVVFGGGARTLAEASNEFLIAVILAVAFIYMVLASQFNSFVHPLTIMTALPLSLPAGLLALMATGMTLNVYSAIGFMMLFGIVKKNSILQVDYTNTLRAKGVGRDEALLAANRVRLRPILMTTLSIMAGMAPIALGRGAGAGSRASMAVTIIGGQLLCLLLTLLVTPVVYSYFEDLRQLDLSGVLRRLRGRPGTPTTAAATERS